MDGGKITKDDNLGELAVKYPAAAAVLAEEYGLHCIGCFAAEFDTLEEGAAIHGYEIDEVEEMVQRLNEVVKQEQK